MILVSRFADFLLLWEIFCLFLCSWLEAGADIIETNTYQASVPGFKKHLGVTEEQALQVGTSNDTHKSSTIFSSNLTPVMPSGSLKILLAKKLEQGHIVILGH